MIGIRELRSDLAVYVRRAAAGESTVVSINGAPAARLGPTEATDRSPAVERAALIASGGLVAPRRSDARAATGAVAVWGNVRLDRLLREIRG